MKDWKKIKLKEIAEINPNTIKKNFKYDTIEYVDISSVGTGTIEKPKIIKLTEAPSRAKRTIRDGSIILSTVRPNRRSFYYFKNAKENLVVSTGFAVLEAKEVIFSRFLYYLINDYKFTEYLTNNAKGAAYPAVDKEIINRAVFFIPTDVNEQKKISTILSNYDDLIENNNLRIEILEEMAQAIYKEWFVYFRFPGHGKVKMVDSELGKIPEGWKVVTVKDIVKHMPTGKKYDNKSVLSKGNVPVLDQGRSGIIGYHNNKPDIFASEDNPIIVFANHTCYQRLIMFQFSAIQNVIPILPSDDNTRDIFWLHFATKDLIHFNDYKGHYPEFSTKKVALPPKSLCEKFGMLIKPFILLKYKLEYKNKNLRETRDILLPKLISGEIDVSDLDIKTEDDIK